MNKNLHQSLGLYCNQWQFGTQITNSSSAAMVKVAWLNTLEMVIANSEVPCMKI